jgi:V/A-type H+-transporting ATPase subunit E
MGIERLTSSLISDANKEAEEIVKNAEWHASQMLEDERKKNDQYIEKAKTDVELSLTEQQNERFAWARLEAKRIMAEAHEDAIKNTLEDFFILLKKVRSMSEYKKFIKSAISEAVADLGDNAITVHVCKGDAQLIGKISNCKIKEDLQGFGGVIVEGSEGQVRVNMALETLFESKRDDLRKQIYDALFVPGTKGSR